jgi:hypothetical protein
VGVRQEPTSGLNPTSSSVHLSQVRGRPYSWMRRRSATCGRRSDRRVVSLWRVCADVLAEVRLVQSAHDRLRSEVGKAGRLVHQDD